MILIPVRFYSILAQVDLIAKRPAIGALEGGEQDDQYQDGSHIDVNLQGASCA